jgi:hypothetical protein
VAKKTLTEELGLDRKRPLPPKYQPKLVVRISDDRTKQVVEFQVPLPLDGLVPGAYDECAAKLRAVLERLGILPAPAKPQATEPLHGEAEESQVPQEDTAHEKSA